MQTESEITPRRDYAYGAAVLGMIGIASFFLVFAVLSDTKSQSTEQSAAVAAADTSAFDALNLQAKAVYVYDIEDKRVLYEKNENVQLPLASLTKVPMALAVSEALPLDSVITIPYDITAPDNSQRIPAGDRITVRDALNFTLAVSSNDGAQVLADAADDAIRAKYPDAPASDATLWRMNQIAKELGLSQTYFLNVNGLDISTAEAGAFGSARDVATYMAFAATSSPSIFSATSRAGMLVTDETGGSARAVNTNEALDTIPGLIMGKTGYTDLAGGNLAVVFDAGPAHPIVAVVLGSTYDGRFNDMEALVRAALQTIARE